MADAKKSIAGCTGVGCASLVMMVVAIFVIGSLSKRESSSQQERRQSGYISDRELPGDGTVLRDSDYGNAWPLTVAAGRINCMAPGKSVVFTAPDGTTYAVNGTAKGSGKWASIERIWRQQPDAEDAPAVTRLPESDRRRIFSDIVRCDDENREPPMGIGQDAGEYRRVIEKAQRGATSCKARLARRSKITSDELQTISTEGILRNWPPLTPTRVSIAPLIERGLQACQ